MGRRWGRARAGKALVVLVSVAVVAGACGDKEDAKPKATTTTAPTTTAVASATGQPLTGLPGEVKQRPALIVKIDNAPKARPQAGLINADVVIEEAVEGGVTRLMVIYQSQDTDEVGPVRSARSTDIHLATALNKPLFSYSGANRVFEDLLRQSTLVNVGPSAKPGAYFRKPGRPAPYDYWGRFPQIYEGAAGSPPPPMFVYRGEGEAAAGTPANNVRFEFRGRIVTNVEWRWDAASSSYRRKTGYQNVKGVSPTPTDHVDANNQPVAPKNVVVQFTEYVNTGLVDASGEPVPEGKIVGEGEAWIFTDGKVITGRWKKDSPEQVTAYTDASGQPVKLTPGQTWLELPKPGTATIF